MNISYEAYRVFYYTAKTRSFTQAANALGNSQPNITRIIKNLERELGCTLFLRNNRHVELTAEGETLYRHVSAAFEQLQAGRKRCSGAAGWTAAFCGLRQRKSRCTSSCFRYCPGSGALPRRPHQAVQRLYPRRHRRAEKRPCRPCLRHVTH